MIWKLYITLIFIILVACTQLKFNKKNYVKQAANTDCCKLRNSNAQCIEELIPGCFTQSSPLFQEEFFKPDSCCSYWGVDGVCYEEKFPGCSEEYKL